jgi:hypothetical protein
MARRLRIASRAALIRLAGLFAVLAGLMTWGYVAMIRMPGASYRGPLPPLTAEQEALRGSLRRDVEALAGSIGPRCLVGARAGLDAAARHLEDELTRAGYAVRRQEYKVEGHVCANLEAEIRGGHRPDQVIIVGAHYDSCGPLPAANDNASGVAATLALARLFAGSRPGRTLRFVLFANEEPPYFQTDAMGSLLYARGCRDRGEDVAAMLSLETIGYYSDEPGSQHYPPPLGMLYPSTGNFIGLIGNVSSGRLVRQVLGSFRRHARFPSEGAALPAIVPGVGWSDHWSFWQVGYPALMVTDTAPFRYPHYHTAGDTPDRLDYDRMARVVDGLRPAIAELADLGP